MSYSLVYPIAATDIVSVFQYVTYLTNHRSRRRILKLYIASNLDNLIQDLKIVKREFVMYAVAVRSLLDMVRAGLS